jgi:hypothetical protein
MGAPRVTRASDTRGTAARNEACQQPPHAHPRHERRMGKAPRARWPVARERGPWSARMGSGTPRGPHQRPRASHVARHIPCSVISTPERERGRAVDGSFPRKRSPGAGDGCTTSHCQPRLLLAAELDSDRVFAQPGPSTDETAYTRRRIWLNPVPIQPRSDMLPETARGIKKATARVYRMTRRNGMAAGGAATLRQRRIAGCHCPRPYIVFSS